MAIIKQSISGDKADVFIDGPIGGPDGITGENFMRELSALNDSCELNVFFNSDGGSVRDGKIIYEAILSWPGRTRGHIQGIAGSISSVIALGCTEIMISLNSIVMIHDPFWSVGSAENMCSLSGQKLIKIPSLKRQKLIKIPTPAKTGNSETRRLIARNSKAVETHRNLLKQRKTLLAKDREFILDVYSSRTGSARSDLSQMMSEQTYLESDSALEFGFCDHITPPTSNLDETYFSQFRNPNNFLSCKYSHSARTARKKRTGKVIRQQTTYMQQRAQKILNNRQEA